jgi:integrase
MSTAEYRRTVQERIGQTADATSGYSVQTIKSALIPLSRTFAYAKRHLGFGGENPVAALDLDERPGYRQHKARKRKLGRDELDRLSEAAESPWREIIATAAALGTRLGETLGICWRHIDFESGLISIEQQANAKREIARVKSESGIRRIEAPDWLLSMLREAKLRSPYSATDDLVFCTATGLPHGHGNVLARGLYPALDRAALPRTSFHSLRHTHASLSIKDGGDVITLSKRLGHATPQVTMSTYADEIEEANDSAIRKARVNALFGGTKMAARLAAEDGEILRQTASAEQAEVVSLPSVRETPQRPATRRANHQVGSVSTSRRSGGPAAAGPSCAWRRRRARPREVVAPTGGVSGTAFSCTTCRPLRSAAPADTDRPTGRRREGQTSSLTRAPAPSRSGRGRRCAPPPAARPRGAAPPAWASLASSRSSLASSRRLSAGARRAPPGGAARARSRSTRTRTGSKYVGRGGGRARGVDEHEAVRRIQARARGPEEERRALLDLVRGDEHLRERVRQPRRAQVALQRGVQPGAS